MTPDFSTVQPVRLSIQNAYDGDIKLQSPTTIRRWVKAAALRPTTITLRFVDTEEGLALNSSYRGRDYATNVLTFDYVHEPEVEADVVICVPVVDREAKEQGKRFLHHMAHMVVHAVLHTHGYDHIEDDEAEEMEALEKVILAHLGYPNPYED